MDIINGYGNVKQYDENIAPLPENKQKSKIYDDIYDLDLEITTEDPVENNDAIQNPPISAGCSYVKCGPTSVPTCKWC